MESSNFNTTIIPQTYQKHHPFIKICRTILSILFAFIFAPFIAPAIFVSLPFCLPIRLLEQFAIRLLYLISSLADVKATFQSRSSIADNIQDSLKNISWLSPPFITCWISPIQNKRYIVTYDQPGRWMSDQQLIHLFHLLKQIGIQSINCLPTHRLFEQDNIRNVFSNRIISIVYDDQGPLGFTAMVYMNTSYDLVVHLGLTMITKRARGQRLQSLLFTKCLILCAINLCRIGYIITNCGASPAGIGSVCDYFLDVYPSYHSKKKRKEYHLTVVNYLLNHYRYEFGASKNATFDPITFVLYCSNQQNGGGTWQFIQQNNQPVSWYKVQSCNHFVNNLLNYKNGDELLQVGWFNPIASLFLFFCMKFRKTTRKIR